MLAAATGTGAWVHPSHVCSRRGYKHTHKGVAERTIMATDSSVFVLLTRDGAKFEVSLKVIRLLRTLDTMLGGKLCCSIVRFFDTVA